MTALETDVLAQLISRKHDCLVQLRDMGRRQLELIDEGQMTALLDVLTTKQRVLQKLQGIERGLDPYRGQDPETRRWRSGEERATCNEQLGQCEQLLAEIISQERCSEGALQQRRDETARQLNHAQQAGHARAAYAEPPRDRVQQIDFFSNS